MGMIGLLFLSLCQIIPMFGLMVVLFLIRLLVFPLLVLVSLLTMLPFLGMSVAGVRLILFTLLEISRLVGVSALFLGLFNLFRELSCGELFWLYSLLVLLLWVWTIGFSACFGMVGFLCCLAFLVPPLALLMRLRVPVTLLKLRLGLTLLVWLLNGVPLMSMIQSRLPLQFLINPMSGLMVALSLVMSLACLLLVLGSLLTSL